MGWDQNGSNGPWGNRPGGQQQPPNLEDILRKGKEHFKGSMPPSFGSSRFLVMIALAVVILWLITGFYKIGPGERGVVLQFGKYSHIAQPGLRYHLPYPIETVDIVSVDKVNGLVIGTEAQSQVPSRSYYRASQNNNSDDDLKNTHANMLTGDENIVKAPFAVQWKINDPAKFLFNLRNPETTIQKVAESAMREIVGQTPIQPILNEARRQIEQDTKKLVQDTLDSFEAGVAITEVQLQNVDTPDEVVDAFRDVQRARADKEKMRNEAETYRNSILPVARGEAVKILKESKAYQEQIVAQAEGEAKRFLEIYGAYISGKDIFIKRFYLETMEGVLEGRQKVIIDQSQNAQSVLPYLPLPQMGAKTGNQNNN